jgi:hypothetical protein
MKKNDGAKMHDDVKMHASVKKDNRNKLWSEIESKIQVRAKNKDPGLVLEGPWKTYLRKQDGMIVYIVDGEWIRNNLSVIFGHGGHGYVHEFIPLEEIWVATSHFKECECNTKGPTSNNYRESTIIHEIAEYKAMKRGINFWNAHQAALEEEKKSGLLKDPYIDEI